MLGIATDPYDRCPWLRDEHGPYTCDPIDYPLARRLVRSVNLRPTDVVYDLGCGLGRIICLAAQYEVRQCIGVELSEVFAEGACENARRLRGRRSPISIIQADAASLDYSDGTVFFLCNPFGVNVLQVVLDNLHDSLTRRPRELRIGYANPIHDDVFEQCDWLERYHLDASLFHERPTSFWRSTAARAAQPAAATTSGVLEYAA
jgi:SAM-dependent methyltransferase